MKKLYEDQDINDIIEAEEQEFFKGGVGSGIKGHRTNKHQETATKLKEIHEFHAKNSDKETQESFKRYLDPKATDPTSHAYRVSSEHAVMHRRGKPSITKSEDINDIIEAEFFKGGPGSGKKGHTTPKPMSEAEAYSAKEQAYWEAKYKENQAKIKANQEKIRENNMKLYNHPDPKKIGT